MPQVARKALSRIFKGDGKEMKRPCAREFGVVKYILTPDDKALEVRAYLRSKLKNYNDTLGKYTASDIDKMIDYLKKAKDYLEWKR